MSDSSYLVGDWSKGAQLFVRENPIVRFFEEDGTNVRENKITVRVEGRIALPIYYTDAFVTGSLNANPSLVFWFNGKSLSLIWLGFFYSVMLIK